MIFPVAGNGNKTIPAIKQHLTDVSDTGPILRNAVQRMHPFHSQATACNIGTTG